MYDYSIIIAKLLTHSNPEDNLHSNFNTEPLLQL